MEFLDQGENLFWLKKIYIRCWFSKWLQYEFILETEGILLFLWNIAKEAAFVIIIWKITRLLCIVFDCLTKLETKIVINSWKSLLKNLLNKKCVKEKFKNIYISRVGGKNWELPIWLLIGTWSTLAVHLRYTFDIRSKNFLWQWIQKLNFSVGIYF